MASARGRRYWFVALAEQSPSTLTLQCLIKTKQTQWTHSQLGINDVWINIFVLPYWNNQSWLFAEFLYFGKLICTNLIGFQTPVLAFLLMFLCSAFCTCWCPVIRLTWQLCPSVPKGQANTGITAPRTVIHSKKLKMCPPVSPEPVWAKRGVGCDDLRAVEEAHQNCARKTFYWDRLMVTLGFPKFYP